MKPNSGSSASPWQFGAHEVVLSAIFSALVVMLHLIGIGSIPVPNLSGAMTTLLIPVLLGAIIGGPLVGMFAGFVMGALYLTMPQTSAFGPITLIVPRLVMALIAWTAYRAVSRYNVVLASVLAVSLGASANTVCAVGIAILLGQIPASVAYVVIPQALIELIACAVLMPIVVVPVKKAMQSRE